MLIAMLIQGVRPGVIAEHFGVDPETARRWRADPEVRRLVDEGHAEIVAGALGEMKALADEIPAALSEALTLARQSKDPYAIKAVVETIADRVGLTKTTRLEQTVDSRLDVTVGVEDLRALLLRAAANRSRVLDVASVPADAPPALGLTQDAPEPPASPEGQASARETATSPPQAVRR